MTTDGKILTIVIPVRNRAGILDGVIESVRNAWLSERFDLVVVDNGSTDGARQRIADELIPFAAEGCRALLVDEPKPGACAARNRGLAEVVTPWVMFFDSDDIFTPAHIRRINRGIRRYGREADILTWDCAIADSRRFPRTPRVATLKHHLFHASLATQRWCASTGFVRRAGGWNESLPAWNDYELGVRMLLLSPGVVKLEGTPEVTYIPHDNSITGTHPGLRIREKSLALDLIEHEILRAGLQRMLPYVRARRMLLAANALRSGDSSAPEVAAELRLRAMAEASGTWERTLLRLIYGVHLRFGAGGSPIGEFLL
ncbi:MAG: glycosyltransferase family 2 protein [Clostridium sp.]|nr:glycosyltransferase family 2 protein [Clostridium sp.]